MSKRIFACSSSCSSISINVYFCSASLFAINSSYTINNVCKNLPNIIQLVFISANLFTNNPYHSLFLSPHAADPTFHYVCCCIDYNENRKSLLYWSMKMEIHLSLFLVEVKGKFGITK